MPAAVADPWCFCVQLQRGCVVGRRAAGIKELTRSTTLDKFFIFSVLEFCSSCGRTSDAEMWFSLVRGKGVSVVLPGSYQASRRRRWLEMRQDSFRNPPGFWLYLAKIERCL